MVSKLDCAVFLLMTYLCEFWGIAVIKCKYCMKIIMEQEIRIAVSSLIPRFELCSAHIRSVSSNCVEREMFLSAEVHFSNGCKQLHKWNCYYLLA